ncbi:hypothetical protein Bbelb_097330 [Branchiostoma belcheri]|nr:hypothetical protein Bbelb_097330 [Branchiostoma belcheri]
MVSTPTSAWRVFNSYAIRHHSAARGASHVTFVTRAPQVRETAVGTSRAFPAFLQDRLTVQVLPGRRGKVGGRPGRYASVPRSVQPRSCPPARPAGAGGRSAGEVRVGPSVVNRVRKLLVPLAAFAGDGSGRVTVKGGLKEDA